MQLDQVLLALREIEKLRFSPSFLLTQEVSKLAAKIAHHLSNEPEPESVAQESSFIEPPKKSNEKKKKPMSVSPMTYTPGVSIAEERTLPEEKAKTPLNVTIGEA